MATKKTSTKAPMVSAAVTDAVVKALASSPPAAKKTSKKKTEAPVKEKAAGKKKAPAETVTLDTRSAKKGQSIHVIAQAARPGAGRALYAHTHAALTALGMFAAGRPIVEKRTLTTLIGPTAVKWHISSGNFTETADHGVRLSEEGYSTFRERASSGKLDAKLSNAFVGLILDGKTDGTNVSKGNTFETQV